MPTPTEPLPPPPRPPGSETPWGRVVAVGMKDRERFYFLSTKAGGIFLVPGPDIDRNPEDFVTPKFKS